MTPQEIKNLRSDLGTTQAELAEIVGVSSGTVARWETGGRIPNQHAQAILQKLRERADRENGPSLGESLLKIAGTAGLVALMAKIFED